MKRNLEYLPIDQAKPGDIVEFNYPKLSSALTHKRLYTFKTHYPGGNIMVARNDDGRQSGKKPEYFKLVKTKPGSEAKVGDEIIMLTDMNYYSPKIPGGGPKADSIWTVSSIGIDGTIHYGVPVPGHDYEYGVQPTDVKVLCKAEEPKKISSFCKEGNVHDCCSYILKGEEGCSSCPAYILPQAEETPQHINPKESETINMKINVNLADILALLAGDTETDLEKSPNTITLVYNKNGKFLGATAESAEVVLQDVHFLGCTVREFTFSAEMTTQIPVITTKRVKTSAEHFEDGASVASAAHDIADMISDGISAFKAAKAKATKDPEADGTPKEPESDPKTPSEDK